MRYRFGDHTLDTGTLQLLDGVHRGRPRAPGVRGPRPPGAPPRPCGAEGGAARRGVGKPVRVGVGADDPDQAGAPRPRRHRTRPARGADLPRPRLPLRRRDRRTDGGCTSGVGAHEDPRAAPVRPTTGTRYAESHGASIAYQTFGDGPDLALIAGFATNVEAQWDHPAIADFLTRLGRIARVTVLDKRGVGLSDRVPHDSVPLLDTGRRPRPRCSTLPGSSTRRSSGRPRAGPSPPSSPPPIPSGSTA